MYLDRGLIKQQARALIRDKVMKLFLVSFIVSICTGAISIVYNVYSSYTLYDNGYYNNYNDYYDNFYNFGDDYSYGSDSDNAYDYGYFDDFGTENGDSYDYRNDFYNFGANIPAQVSTNAAVGSSAVLSVLSWGSTILSILLAPLSLALTYFYVELVTGKEYEFSAGLKSVFKNAFQVTYLKKIGAYLLQRIILSLLLMLFIVPGIIFGYSSYFTYEIMCEYPEISPWQAIQLSKKMIRGHRTELFVLDLSFIPWALLCVFIFPLIYVIPYMSTTRALYYENFKMRALQTGVMTEDDFLSDVQKMNKYTSGGMGYGPNPQNQNPPYGSQGWQNQQYAQTPPQGPNGTYNNGGNYYQPNQQYYNPQQNGTNANNGTYGYYGNAPQNGAQPYNTPPVNPVYQPTYFTPVMPQEQPAYYNPDIQPHQNNGEPKDIFGNMANDTTQPADAAPPTGQEHTNGSEQPQVTVTESFPQEPQTPQFAEPQEPTEDFTEPQEPVDADGNIQTPHQDPPQADQNSAETDSKPTDDAQ